MVLTRYRGPVVAITDEVDPTHFVDFDRWIPMPGGHQTVDAPPAVPKIIPPWQESTIKIVVATHTAHDVVQRYVLEAQFEHVAQFKLVAYLFERQ